MQQETNKQTPGWAQGHVRSGVLQPVALAKLSLGGGLNFKKYPLMLSALSATTQHRLFLGWPPGGRRRKRSKTTSRYLLVTV